MITLAKPYPCCYAQLCNSCTLKKQPVLEQMEIEMKPSTELVPNRRRSILVLFVCFCFVLLTQSRICSQSCEPCGSDPLRGTFSLWLNKMPFSNSNMNPGYTCRSPDCSLVGGEISLKRLDFSIAN